MLVAKDRDARVEPRRAQRREIVVRQLLREVDTDDFRRETVAERIDLERHPARLQQHPEHYSPSPAFDAPAQG